MLQTLLRGAPEIAIVVDRRAASGGRRRNGKRDGHGRPVAYVVDRRETDAGAAAVVLPGLRRRSGPPVEPPKTRAKIASTWVR